MAFPSTSVLDNFTRANGALGTNWSNDPLHGGSTEAIIVSDLASNTTGGDFASQWWNAASFANSAGLECYVTVAAIPGTASAFNGIYPGLVQQPSAASATADGYQVGATRDPDQYALFRYDNAVETQLGAAVSQSAMAISDVIGLNVTTAATNNIIAFRNGTAIVTRSDTTYFHAGQSAFAEFDFFSNAPSTNPCRISNFGGGQTVTGGTNGGVTAPAGALVLAADTATITATGTVTAPAGTLTLSGDTPTIKNLLPAPAGALVLSADTATLRATGTVTAAAGGLVLAGDAPSLGGTTTVTAPAGSLTLAGDTPSLRFDTHAVAPAGALVLAGLPSTIDNGTGIAAIDQEPDRTVVNYYHGH